EADRASRERNSIGTIFAIGSVTKTFTAAAIELLAGRGLLRYSDALDKYVPEYRYAKDVTIEQLLGHTAGIPDFYALPAFAAMRSQDLTLSRVAKWLSDFPLDFTPGTKSRYSNSGYSLLALVIERVSGEAYGDFLHDNVFVPLGLRHTFSGASSEAGSIARGYDPGPAPVYLQTAATIAPGWLRGNGSVYSTAADLSRWLDVAAAGTFTNFKTLPYPYGWSQRTIDGAVVLGQNGRIPGFASDISIDERSGLKVIVLSNVQCAATSTIAGDIRRAAGGAQILAPPIRPSYTPSAAQLALYVGQYALPSLPLLVFSESGSLFLSNMNDGMKLPLDAIGPGRFFFRPLYAYVTFETDSHGIVNSITWNRQLRIPRVSPRR
ncbi:MAG: serine hydrolase, partial [Candidatus Eremiobacteraeota bacterium]|nr:serine hydrolase [Candidatus Eremiobacteraeota bacterium]